MPLFYCEQNHIDGQFLDQPNDYRQNGKNLMIMLLIIWPKFDAIGPHLPIETRVLINNVIAHSKHIRKSIHQIDDPFLDQPVDYHKK